MKYWILLLTVGLSVSALAQNSPNISANALFLYRNSNLELEDSSTTRNGIDLQEAEIAFYSDVDPYHKLFLLLAVAPEYEFDSVNNEVTQSWLIEPEVLYFETTQIPGVTIKAGKFKAAFGKHNPQHTHAQAFVESPLAHTQLLGDEGLNDVGLSAAFLVPFSWFSELTLQTLRGEGENAEFNSPQNGDGVGLIRWTNLFDLSEEGTFELGLSGARGQNYLNNSTQLQGIDFTFKWRPIEGGKYHSWIFGIESLRRRLEQPSVNPEISTGSVLWGQYQFAQRWSVALRLENLKTVDSDSTVNSLSLPNETSTRSSVALNFNPTEFSQYRLELGKGKLPPNTNNETDEQRIFLQANFTIGAHPAHAY